MKKLLPLFAVVFPLLLMSAWIGKHYVARHSSDSVELKITGYDPRDLLSGHYLTYRVDYGPRGTCDKTPEQSQCMCLEVIGPRKVAQATWVGQCDNRPQSCELWMKGICGSGFEAGIERFYFPEMYKTALRRVPENSTIVVMLSADGRAQVADLLVDGKPVLSLLKENPHLFK